MVIINWVHRVMQRNIQEKTVMKDLIIIGLQVK